MTNQTSAQDVAREIERIVDAIREGDYNAIGGWCFDVMSETACKLIADLITASHKCEWVRGRLAGIEESAYLVQTWRGSFYADGKYRELAVSINGAHLQVAAAIRALASAAPATDAWRAAHQPRCGWCGNPCVVDDGGVRVCPDHPMHDIQRIERQ